MVGWEYNVDVLIVDQTGQYGNYLLQTVSWKNTTKLNICTIKDVLTLMLILGGPGNGILILRFD